MLKTTMMRRTVVPLLTAGAIAGGVAAPANAMQKGLEDDSMVLSDNAATRAAFWSAAKEARVKVVRVVPRWDPGASQVDPATVTRVTRAIDEGRAAGAKLLIGLYQGNFRGKSASSKVSSTFQKNYIWYFQSLATAIKDKPVYGYLTWNEPNYGTTWPQKRAKQWPAFSNRVYKALKKSDKGAKVFVGETAPNVRNATGKSSNPGAFFRTALCLKSNYKPSSNSKACRTKLLGDGFTLHTYDFDYSPTKKPSKSRKDWWVHGNLTEIKSQLKKLVKAKRLSSTAARNIHISEFAYRTEAPNNKFSQSTVAKYTKSAWNSAKKAGIKSFTWYILRNPANPADNFRSGLQSSNGTPYPVWNTFKALK
jgi:hypothetical protein